MRRSEPQQEWSCFNQRAARRRLRWNCNTSLSFQDYQSQNLWNWTFCWDCGRFSSPAVQVRRAALNQWLRAACVVPLAVLDLIRTETLLCLDPVSLQPFVLFCSDWSVEYSAEVYLSQRRVQCWLWQILKVQYVRLLVKNIYCVEETSGLSALWPETSFSQRSNAPELTELTLAVRLQVKV